VVRGIRKGYARGELREAQLPRMVAVLEANKSAGRCAAPLAILAGANTEEL